MEYRHRQDKPAGRSKARKLPREVRKRMTSTLSLKAQGLTRTQSKSRKAFPIRLQHLIRLASIILSSNSPCRCRDRKPPTKLGRLSPPPQSSRLYESLPP